MQSSYSTYICNDCGRFFQKRKYPWFLFIFSIFRAIFGCHCPKCGSSNTEKLVTKSVLSKKDWH